KLRRVVGAAAQDHLLAGADLDRRTVVAALEIAHANRALAFEDDVGRVRMGPHMHVRPLARRMQERGRRTDAQALLDGALGVGDAFLDRAVVVGIAGNAEAHRTRHEGLAQRIPPVHRGDGEVTVAAAEGILALADTPFEPLEVRQNVRIAPAAIAHLRPGIEILALAAIIDMAVDGRRAAKRLAAWRIDAAAAGIGTGLLLVGPVDALHVESLDEARRQMDVGMPVARARFEHADRGICILTQSVGEHAAGRTGANDHIIERFHRSPYLSYRCAVSPAACR